MGPRVLVGQTGVLYEDEPVDEVIAPKEPDQKPQSQPEPQPQSSEPVECRWVWRNIIIFALLHLAAIYGAFLVLARAKLWTNIWGRYRVAA